MSELRSLQQRYNESRWYGNNPQLTQVANANLQRAVESQRRQAMYQQQQAGMREAFRHVGSALFDPPGIPLGLAKVLDPPEEFYISPSMVYVEGSGPVAAVGGEILRKKETEEDIIFNKLMEMTYEDMLNGAMEEL